MILESAEKMHEMAAKYVGSCDIDDELAQNIIECAKEDGRRLWCGQDRTDIYRPYQEDKA